MPSARRATGGRTSASRRPAPSFGAPVAGPVAVASGTEEVRLGNVGLVEVGADGELDRLGLRPRRSRRAFKKA